MRARVRPQWGQFVAPGEGAELARKGPEKGLKRRAEGGLKRGSVVPKRGQCAASMERAGRKGLGAAVS